MAEKRTLQPIQERDKETHIQRQRNAFERFLRDGPTHAEWCNRSPVDVKELSDQCAQKSRDMLSDVAFLDTRCPGYAALTQIARDLAGQLHDNPDDRSLKAANGAIMEARQKLLPRERSHDTHVMREAYKLKVWTEAVAMLDGPPPDPAFNFDFIKSCEKPSALEVSYVATSQCGCAIQCSLSSHYMEPTYSNSTMLRTGESPVYIFNRPKIDQCCFIHAMMYRDEAEPDNRSQWGRITLPLAACLEAHWPELFVK